jgi:tRNA pseudouridine38-40 synthase
LISYDGSAFHGFQRQANASPTVEEVVEKALTKIFGQRVTIAAAGRTDCGVHALGQVVHFNAPSDKPLSILQYTLGYATPPGLTIRCVYRVPEEFHAMHSSCGKSYIYKIVNRDHPSAIRRNFVEWIDKPLDVHRLNKMASLFIGDHDFRSFQTSNLSPEKSTVRRINEASWIRQGDDLTFRIKGSGFLRNMVRNIVGTSLHLHDSEDHIGKFEALLSGNEKRVAGHTAAPRGLYLEKIYYPEELVKQFERITGKP